MAQRLPGCEYLGAEAQGELLPVGGLLQERALPQGRGSGEQVQLPPDVMQCPPP